MKIAFVTFEYPPNLVGGAGTYARYIVKELAKLGHEIHVITPRGKEWKEEGTNDGISFHGVRNLNLPYFSAVSSMLKLRPVISAINRNIGGFDILQENSQHAFQLLFQFLPRQILPIPHVVTVHSLSYQTTSAGQSSFLRRLSDRGEENYVTEFSERAILPKADKLIANSFYTKNVLISQYGIQDSKIKVIYMGHTELELKDSDAKTARSLPMPSTIKEPILLFVGRLVRRKGLLNLLKAAGELKLRNVGFKLIIVGTGPEENLCRYQVKELKLERHVIFTGFVDDHTLKELYKASDVVTVPSINEPFGLVVVDAMFAGKPIVASKTGGIPEIVEDRANGLLVDPQNTEAYADALQHFLQHRETSIKIGRVNRIKAAEKFTWKACAQQLSSTYQTLLENAATLGR
jgi:glycosyltransferase involved in cell wall biosynthesis